MKPMFIIDTSLYQELLGYCDMLGLPGISEAEARRREAVSKGGKGGNWSAARYRTAVHEAGHALAYMIDGVRFDRILIKAPPSDAGALVARARPTDVRMPPIEARIAGCLGGVVAEEVILGDVCAFGAWRDFRTALVHARDPAIACIQVDRLRSLMSTHFHALLALATSLLWLGSLTAELCGTIVLIGELAVDEPRYDPICPEDEKSRRAEAHREMEGQKEARRPVKAPAAGAKEGGQ